MISTSLKIRTKVRSIFIKPDGDVEAVHNPVLDRIDLGPRVVKRASHITFNNEMQRWEATFVDQPDITMQSESRDALIEGEVLLLTSQLREKIQSETTLPPNPPLQTQE